MIRALTLLIVSGALFSAPAFANRPAMEPQVRVHLGASAVPGPGSIGIMGGMDSRLTRMIYVDAGGLATLSRLPEEVDLAADPADNFRLRHSVYLTPGFRIPHRQPNLFSWDVTFRLGAGMIWSADLDPGQVSVTTTPAGYEMEVDPAGVGGVDLLLRKNAIGLRASGKVFAARTMHAKDLEEFWYWAPQVGLEALYQF